MRLIRLIVLNEFPFFFPSLITSDTSRGEGRDLIHPQRTVQNHTDPLQERGKETCTKGELCNLNSMERGTRGWGSPGGDISTCEGQPNPQGQLGPPRKILRLKFSQIQLKPQVQ